MIYLAVYVQTTNPLKITLQPTCWVYARMIVPFCLGYSEKQMNRPEHLKAVLSRVISTAKARRFTMCQADAHMVRPRSTSPRANGGAAQKSKPSLRGGGRQGSSFLGSTNYFRIARACAAMGAAHRKPVGN